MIRGPAAVNFTSGRANPVFLCRQMGFCAVSANDAASDNFNVLYVDFDFRIVDVRLRPHVLVTVICTTSAITL